MGWGGVGWEGGGQNGTKPLNIWTKMEMLKVSKNDRNALSTGKGKIKLNIYAYLSVFLSQSQLTGSVEPCVYHLIFLTALFSSIL